MLIGFIAAIALTAILWTIAWLHYHWGNGGLWPAKNEADLARLVVGAPGISRMPRRTACFAVAVAVFIAGLWPLEFVGILPLSLPFWLAILAGVGLAAIFLARGAAAYLPAFRKRFPEEPFATMDRRFYGPLCLLIGLGFAFLLTLLWIRL